MSDAKVETNAAEQAPQTHENKLPGIGAFIAFILAVIMFSGVFAKMPDAYKWLSALDFSTLVGKFGTRRTSWVTAATVPAAASSSVFPSFRA